MGLFIDVDKEMDKLDDRYTLREIGRKERNELMKYLEFGTTKVKVPQWTPCSKSLPCEDTDVIVSVLDDSGDYPYRYTTFGWHYKGIWVVDGERCVGDVEAWMPLPEAYEEG